MRSRLRVWGHRLQDEQDGWQHDAVLLEMPVAVTDTGNRDSISSPSSSGNKTDVSWPKSLREPILSQREKDIMLHQTSRSLQDQRCPQALSEFSDHNHNSRLTGSLVATRC